MRPGREHRQGFRVFAPAPLDPGSRREAFRKVGDRLDGDLPSQAVRTPDDADEKHSKEM